MPDLLEGRVSLGGFLEKLRDFWWHRVRVDDQPRGLYSLMLERDFEAAVERFERAYRADPLAACRQSSSGTCSGGWPTRRASPAWSR